MVLWRMLLRRAEAPTEPQENNKNDGASFGKEMKHTSHLKGWPSINYD